MLVSLQNLKGFSIRTNNGPEAHVHDVYFTDHTLKDQFLLGISKNVDSVREFFVMKTYDTKGIREIDTDHSELSMDHADKSQQYLLKGNEIVRVDIDKTEDGSLEVKELPTVGTLFHNAVSLDDLVGIEVIGNDGKAGHVVDFVLDRDSNQIKYVAVDTESIWYPSNISLIPLSHTMKINPQISRMRVDLSKDEVKMLPDYPRNTTTFPEL